MTKDLGTIAITDLRKSTATTLKRASKSSRPIVITQRGKAVAVLLSPGTYQRAQHERDLLLILARGEREIAEGLGYDFDTVFEEADRVLSGE